MKIARIALTSLTLALPMMLADSALADSGVNVGGLSCTVEGGIGLIIGSKREMMCQFQPANGSNLQSYRGSIGELGLDIGVTGTSYINWLVFAPGTVRAGALEGTYAGVSGEATIGVGLGANVLVGGSNQSIALQPLSVEGQTGLNVAAGISKMKLHYVPSP
jgi:hypothetical protein